MKKWISVLLLCLLATVSAEEAKKTEGDSKAKDEKKSETEKKPVKKPVKKPEEDPKKEKPKKDKPKKEEDKKPPKINSELLPITWDCRIVTKDKHKLRCTYYQPRHIKAIDMSRAVILVHMLGGKPKDWKFLPTRLCESGMAVLVVQLRGHDSRLKETERWQTYERKEYNAMVEDIFAAKKWLKAQQKVNFKKFALVGAQLGANICLKAMETDKEFLACFCLSPGLNYRGIKIDPSLKKVKDRPLKFVAAKEDGYSIESLKKFKASGVTIELFEEDEDLFDIGTELLKSEKKLGGKIVTWLKKNF